MAVKTMCKTISVVALVVLFSACGGTGQDEGKPANTQKVLSGLAIDGYVARATVFVDTNNNGTRDAWEDWAFTDNDGYFSYNPQTSTDYCAENATTEQRQYCLVLRTSLTAAIIRIDSGYDIQTGEPLVGQLSRRVSFADTVMDNLIISPITSLVTAQESDAAQNVILNRLGLTQADLDVDYLSSRDVNERLLNTAVKIHKTVAVLADRLTDTYDEIGDNLGTPNDASKAVYDSLAESVWASRDGFEQTIAQSDTLVAILDRAEDAIREIYVQRELTLPADLGSNEQSPHFARTVDVVRRLGPVIDQLIVPESTLSLAQATGSVRALESVVIKAITENQHSDTTLDNAINFFNNDANRFLVDSLTEVLSLPTSDLNQLARNDFSGDDFDSPDDFVTQVSLPEGATAFSDIAGSMVQLSDPDLGYAPDNLKDIEVQLYFTGEAMSTAGSVVACAKYIEDARDDGTLGEGNTRGTLVNGYWSLLTTNGDAHAYSLLLTLDFLGATYQSVIKPAGTVSVDGKEKMALRFDFDGDIRDWHTENGFEFTASLPASSDDCTARLPSRVGL